MLLNIKKVVVDCQKLSASSQRHTWLLPSTHTLLVCTSGEQQLLLLMGLKVWLRCGLYSPRARLLDCQGLLSLIQGGKQLPACSQHRG